MKLRDIYAAVNPALSFEFFPPKTEKGEANLFKRIETLKTLSPAFFSMTYGAGGSTREKTVSLGRRIREASGVETVCHVTCVGQSKDEVRSVIKEIGSLGMENIMALRGDPPRGETNWQAHPDGFNYAAELVREIKRIGGFSTAVAGFPETHPEAVSREADLRYLKEKVEAGADAVVTQLFFDNEDFYRFDRDLKALGVDVPIVPGIIPILSAEQIRRFAEQCGARIPPKLNEALDGVAGDDEAGQALGIEYATRQIRELLDYGVPGVHIYCLNRAKAAVAIINNLGLS